MWSSSWDDAAMWGGCGVMIWMWSDNHCRHYKNFATVTVLDNWITPLTRITRTTHQITLGTQLECFNILVSNFSPILTLNMIRISLTLVFRWATSVTILTHNASSWHFLTIDSSNRHLLIVHLNCYCSSIVINISLFKTFLCPFLLFHSQPACFTM